MPSVTIPESLAQAARMQADILNEQINYWAMLGKIAEENPRVPFKLIQDFLQNEPY